MKIRTVLLCVFALCIQVGLAWGGTTPAAVLPLPPYIPAEYQAAVSKVLPGYEIFRNEDFLQDESWLSKFRSPDEIAARKKRAALGFIAGRFNDDSFPDFAALVVNRSIKQARPAGSESYPWEEHVAVRLVVCLGSSTPREYRCEILSTLSGNFGSLPVWADLLLIKSGEAHCEADDNPDELIAAFYPEGWKGKRSDVVSRRKIHPNYDAIGQYSIGNNDGMTLIRGGGGGYLDCAGTD